jgi:hypothetical protein
MLSFRYNFKQLISEIQVMENVSFINIDDEGIDLILSFAVYDSDPSDIESLILMRTPSYEFFQEEHERGVSVSFKNIEDSFRLKGVLLGDNVVEIFDEENKYVLDMRRVEKEGINELEGILKKMNFDNSFTINHV